jgi:hypothetical protein
VEESFANNCTRSHSLAAPGEVLMPSLHPNLTLKRNISKASDRSSCKQRKSSKHNGKLRFVHVFRWRKETRHFRYW